MDEEIVVPPGRELLVARKMCGVPQDVLAVRSGLFRATIVDIERGRLVPLKPSMDELVGMVKQLGKHEGNREAMWDEARMVRRINRDPQWYTRRGGAKK